MEVDRLEYPYPSDCLDLTSEEATKYSAYSEMYNVNYDIHVSFDSKFFNFCTLIFTDHVRSTKEVEGRGGMVQMGWQYPRTADPCLSSHPTPPPREGLVKDQAGRKTHPSPLQLGMV